MLEKNIVSKKIFLFILPYIFLYAIYIQINGEISPGGGFQAGVIFASSLIALDLIYGRSKFHEYFPMNLLISLAVIGVFIYLSVGFISLIFADNYLNYYSLYLDNHLAQKMGIFTIEIGVGITVASVMTIIYSLFQEKFE
ncbi:MAG: Na(+)/H(+) antiporter subunit B [Janthinobacterium lividum]